MESFDGGGLNGVWRRLFPLPIGQEVVLDHESAALQKVFEGIRTPDVFVEPVDKGAHAPDPRHRGFHEGGHGPARIPIAQDIIFGQNIPDVEILLNVEDSGRGISEHWHGAIMRCMVAYVQLVVAIIENGA